MVEQEQEHVKENKQERGKRTLYTGAMSSGKDAQPVRSVSSMLCTQNSFFVYKGYHTLLRVSKPAREQCAVSSIDSVDVSKRASVLCDMVNNWSLSSRLMSGLAGGVVDMLLLCDRPF